ncbi:hypothetical protein SAY87_008764 [Trapa incisa]|uniref:Mitochondrial transcription termination factor n=2 Tax=Trapa TaxID=22665 RepID=A0AAN7MM20_TRANT|nr:hypothetical protein SAY87_008764 [Trapa incisa]KAK4797556.1 hypothetical protein SAY86_029882 [Trapa natans]
MIRNAMLKHVPLVNQSSMVSHLLSTVSSIHTEEHRKSTTISDYVKEKGLCADSSKIGCTTNSNVYDLVHSMTQLNVGALVPIASEDKKSAVEIIAERGEECVVLSDNLPKDSSSMFKQWGCSDDDIAQLFKRQPSLREARLDRLGAKLSTLSRLGIMGPDLVKVINCRPRFLWRRLNFDERINYFLSFFGSKEMLRKAIVKNPSFLTHDFHNRIKPSISLYEQLGIPRNDLIHMLMSHPTMISRTSFEPEKVEYIHRTGVPTTSKMYKYVVTLIGISRLETIREKMANLERFGFSEDEVLRFIGRSPLLLTLSVDKVQRNMTFILATMKTPARAVLEYPHFLYCNLEATMRPRITLAAQIRDMGLQPQIDGTVYTALRMTEKRFLKAYVSCHPKDVAEVLMETYNHAKGIKRLAGGYKKMPRTGFPF